MTLRIAIAKGYLLAETVPLLEKLGITCDHDLIQTRHLRVTDTSGQYEFLLVRPWDVPVFVEKGAADLGIVGTDVLDEQSPQVARLLNLKFGACQLVLAGLSPTATVAPYSRIATKYPQLTHRFFHQHNLTVTITKLYGSIESAPLTGLADYIVDLTASGATLKANGLHILDTLLQATACLIANPVRLRYLYPTITPLVRQLSHQP